VLKEYKEPREHKVLLVDKVLKEGQVPRELKVLRE
jgi:hypothetical protein